MRADALLIQLHAWAREELAAQRRLQTILNEQERALREGSSAGVHSAGRALEAAQATNPAREQRRRRLMQGCAAALGIEGGVITLGRIAERARAQGLDTTHLALVRDELRACVAGVTGSARRIGALARYHQELLGELMLTLATASVEDSESGGVLVDAEA